VALLVQATLIQSFISPQPSFHVLQESPLSILTPNSSPRLSTRITQLHAKSGTKKKKVKDGTIAVNRQARRNYEVLSTYDAGISLLGSEVKAIRDGRMNIRDGFVRPDNTGRGCTLYNVHISKMGGNEYFSHEERRPRPLLLTKEEGRKLKRQVDIKGYTIVPLKAYFNENNLVKVQIGLCKGKNVRDKRSTIKDREAKKDANRMIKNFRLN
jgi:SsrA-binding protein